ncbi:hypothetical protein C0995_013947 [Termitomyces sp. Mi166|nr:hypothetical protein C0995_013947 [Termitomyces sp. Mi166\
MTSSLSVPSSPISSMRKERDSVISIISPIPVKPCVKGVDAALAILEESVKRDPVSEEEDRKVLRKIDLWVMPVVLLVYFTQQLDNFVLPDSPTTAKFLDRKEKVIALERLRTNDQVWKWEQVWDTFIDPKTYLWFALLFVCALPSGGIVAFHAHIEGFGFDQFHTILFNIPFGAFQVLVTLLSAYVSTETRLKWPVIFALTLPPIGGASALLVLGRTPDWGTRCLVPYALERQLLFFTGLRGTYALRMECTKYRRKHHEDLCNWTEDKPFYHRGLIADLICWIILAALTLVTAAFLAFRNQQHANTRARMGKTAVIVDVSLEKHVKTGDGPVNDQAFLDLTDSQNEDFIFAL